MASVNLTRSRSVLDMDPPGATVMGNRAPTFRHRDDEPSHNSVISIDPDLWEDMGRPEQITVTIEPGDHLNDTPAKVDVSETAVAAAKAALVTEAEALGITVDARWGVKRLTDEIAAKANVGQGS